MNATPTWPSVLDTLRSRLREGAVSEPGRLSADLALALAIASDATDLAESCGAHEKVVQKLREMIHGIRDGVGT